MDHARPLLCIFLVFSAIHTIITTMPVMSYLKKTLFDRDSPPAVVQLVVSKCIGVMLT